MALAAALALLLGLSCRPGEPPGGADPDGDGVPVAADLCPDTGAGEVVDAGGCALALGDDPGDSVGSDPGDTLGLPGPGFRGGDPGAGPPPAADSAGPAPGYTAVEVFYGTDRAPTGATEPDARFGSELGELGYGTVRVSIPLRHEAGRLEGPSIACLDDEEPGEHVLLLDLSRLGREAWLERLGAALGTAGRDHVLVYVHGYNTSFQAAVRRAAQLSFDLSFRGVPAAYSWPSKGTLRGYPSDEETVQLSAPNLERFLADLVDRAGRGNVHVVAHSLGNRLLADALRRLARARADSLPLLGQVVMAAPDMNALLFERQVAPEIRGLAERVTLYASTRDRALQIAMEVKDYPRAGQAGEGVVVVEGVETVDASRAVTDLLGHGYFSENKRLVDDIFLLVRHGFPPPERNLRPIPHPQGGYWAIP